MVENLIKNAEPKFNKVIDFFKNEIASLRTGRATPALVENIKVEAYGQTMSLSQLATISIPQSNMIIIQPWDKATLPAIGKAITSSNIGLNPIADGDFYRLALPSLTQERRGQLIKVLKEKMEEARISIRNIREDVWKEIQKMEKEKKISEDERFKGKDNLQKATDDYIKKIDDVGKAKEKEIASS